MVDIKETLWAVFITTENYTDENMVSKIQSVWKNVFDKFFETSIYKHADFPELKVYCLNEDESGYCEIWIPIQEK